MCSLDKCILIKAANTILHTQFFQKQIRDSCLVNDIAKHVCIARYMYIVLPHHGHSRPEQIMAGDMSNTCAIQWNQHPAF